MLRLMPAVGLCKESIIARGDLDSAGQGYSPTHHDGVFGQYRDGDIGERNNVVEEADGTKVGFGGCLKGLLAFNLLSCRGIGVFARQRTQEGTEAKTPVGPIYAGDMVVTWPGGGSSTPYRRPDGSTTVMDAFVAGHFRVVILAAPDHDYEAKGLTADHNFRVVRLSHHTTCAAAGTDTTSIVTDYGTSFGDTIELLEKQLHPVALTLAKTGKATFVKKRVNLS